ncbi:carbohydrate kinase family protein [Patescibacteria group bacterium]|nr:MAG: carbohydrate kinase family protein [Patescibacteria group bacterium]
MFDLVAVGDIKLDTFVVLNEASVQCSLKMPECLLCLEYGAKIPVNVVDAQIAGSAPNVAVGLSRMGLKTAVVSVMGEDGTRALALKRLKEEKVASTYIHVSKRDQSAYSVVLNYKGDRTILASQIAHEYRLPRKMARTKWLYVCEMGVGYENLYKEVAARAKSDGMLVGFNPGTIQIAERKKVLFDLISRTYALFVNLEEAQALTEQRTTEIHHLATALYKLGPKKVVITDGKNGSYSFDGQELHHCDIFPGKMVESTGAGDAFATGYLGALTHGQLHDEALRWGSVNAASVVGRVGPQPGLLKTSQIRSRLRQHPSFRAQLM